MIDGKPLDYKIYENLALIAQFKESRNGRIALSLGLTFEEAQEIGLY